MESGENESNEDGSEDMGKHHHRVQYAFFGHISVYK